MNWKIYYSDGTVISSDDATAFSLERRTGIQAIIQSDNDRGWIALSGDDYYMWDDRGGGAKWFKGDNVGFFQYIIQPGSKAVLLGEFVDTIVYRRILERANKDRTFVSKTGWSNLERQPV
jgi:hypothetical protein